MAALVIDNVQVGDVVLGTSVTSVTDAISSVDLSKSIIIVNGVTCTLGVNEPRIPMVSAELTDVDEVTFYRGATGEELSIRYTVIEFSSGIDVQAGTESNSWGGGTDNIAISSVSGLDVAVPIVSCAGDPGTDHNPYGTFEITAVDNLQVIVPDSVWTSPVCWQVAEIDDADVAAYSGSLDNDGSTDVAITSVSDVAKTMLFGSYREDSSSRMYGDEAYVWFLEASNNVEYQRGWDSGGASEKSYVVTVVEIGGATDIDVQRGSATFGASATVTDAISSVDLDVSWLSMTMSNTEQPFNTSSPMDYRSYVNGYLSDVDEVSFAKNDATDRDEFVRYEVVEIAASVATAGPLVNSSSRIKQLVGGALA